MIIINFPIVPIICLILINISLKQEFEKNIYVRFNYTCVFIRLKNTRSSLLYFTTLKFLHLETYAAIFFPRQNNTSTRLNRGQHILFEIPGAIIAIPSANAYHLNDFLIFFILYYYNSHYSTTTVILQWRFNKPRVRQNAVFMEMVWKKNIYIRIYVLSYYWFTLKGVSRWKLV